MAVLSVCPIHAGSPDRLIVWRKVKQILSGENYIIRVFFLKGAIPLFIVKYTIY